MKIRIIGHILGGILLSANALLSLLLIACAYSPHLNPLHHPYLSNLGLAFFVFFLLSILFIFFWLIINWKFALLSILSLLLCSKQCMELLPIHPFREPPPTGCIKFLSYNVMAFDADKPNTEDSPNKILVYLQNCDADIICLQEFIPGSRLKKKEVDKALAKYSYKHYFPLANGRNGLGCYSRYPILSAKHIKYESKANGSILYTVKIGLDTLTIINNHLESNKLTIKDKKMYNEFFSEHEKQHIKHNSRYLINKLAEAVKIRAKQADKVAQIILEKKTKYLIACGDFNDCPISYTHHTLEKGLTDAFTQSGNGMGISYHQNGFYFRIDNILISKNMQSYLCTVDDKIKSSDHYPIWCYLQKKEIKGSETPQTNIFKP